MTINRIPLLYLAEVMQKISETPVHQMTWWKGRITSPTLPSSFMTW